MVEHCVPTLSILLGIIVRMNAEKADNTNSLTFTWNNSLPLFEQIAQAEGEYIKNISNGVPKTALSASNTTKDDDEKVV